MFKYHVFRAINFVLTFFDDFSRDRATLQTYLENLEKKANATTRPEIPTPVELQGMAEADAKNYDGCQSIVDRAVEKGGDES